MNTLRLALFPKQPIFRARMILGLISVSLFLAACGQTTASSTLTAVPTTAPPSNLSTTTNCTIPAALTPGQTEGPYFKSGSPERASLIEANTTGTKLVLSGYVYTANCQPIAHAQLDFWQADDKGTYDNNGYTLRGHQYTDANGRYQLTTIIPGLYPGRTEHIHVKVQAPNGPLLTSQLYFPGVSQNESDGIFDPALVMSVQSAAGGANATFNFVVSQ